MLNFYVLVHYDLTGWIWASCWRYIDKRAPVGPAVDRTALWKSYWSSLHKYDWALPQSLKLCCCEFPKTDFSEPLAKAKPRCREV